MTVMAKKKTFQKEKSNRKHGKNKKKGFKAQGKRGRLVVRNLPFTCTEEELSAHFAEFGEIVDINLLRRPDNKPTGCGFIEFATKLSATKALQELNGKPLGGRTLYIDRAVARDSFNQVVEIKQEKEDEEYESKDVNIKEEEYSDSDDYNSDDGGQSNEQGSETDPVNDKSSRKARLIVRNLSFKTTEDNLREHFASYGDVVDVKLLRRSDSRLVGCGFVQFTRKQSAAKAIHYTSGKPFLDRVIIVDWAVPKDKFLKISEEQQNQLQTKIKEENDEADDANVPIKKEDNEEEIKQIKIKEDSDDDTSLDSEDESEEEEDDDDDDEDDDDDDDDNQHNNEDRKPKINSETSVEQKKVRTKSDDVSEGKTVFLKNVPFSVNNDQLKECLEQFGPVFYALVCIDPLTEHSRGTAFVKFKTKESAEKCLQAGTELTLSGSVIYPYPALKREEVKNKKEETKNVKKDNRNLYLVKEGVFGDVVMAVLSWPACQSRSVKCLIGLMVLGSLRRSPVRSCRYCHHHRTKAIMAGTPAAKGVSVSDMEQRLQLERWKNQMLRNLNMFVSCDRLVIHNLPPSYDDKKLRRLFQRHSGPKAVIKEARVMRDLRNVDPNGIGKSKGYGFVSYTTHEDALAALRKINNNPNIFKATKRPIVGFCVENRAVLNAKRKRLEKSRQHNPLCSEYSADKAKKEDFKNSKQRKKDQRGAFTETRKSEYSHENDNEPNYAGFTAKPGSTKMRTKFHLRTEAKLHVKQAKKDKQRSKLSRKQRKIESQRTLEKRQDKAKKAKRDVQNDDVEFTQLVNKYKSQIMSEKARKKWYE